MAVTTNNKRLIEKSIVPRLAREIATQATAGIGNARRLKELTLTPQAADLVASAIGGATVPRNKLAELGVNSVVIPDLT